MLLIVLFVSLLAVAWLREDEMRAPRMCIYVLYASLFVVPCTKQQAQVTAEQNPMNGRKWVPLSVLAANHLPLLQTETEHAPLPKSSKVKQEGIVLSGRVFAITKLGDLKPGRLAKVYLLWGSPGLNSNREVDTVTGRGLTKEQNPELVYLSKKLDQQQAASKRLPKTTSTPSRQTTMNGSRVNVS